MYIVHDETIIELKLYAPVTVVDNHRYGYGSFDKDSYEKHQIARTAISRTRTTII